MTLVILFSLVKGDWRNWEKYYPTMLFMSLSAFIYEFISHSNYHLWELNPDLIFNRMIVHFTNNLIVNPLVVLTFLSNYPSILKKKITYFLKWTLTFLLIEWGGHQLGMLSYHNGWHFGWSSLFVIIMFPMIRLHHINKLRALILSVIFAVFYLVIFNYI
ncbi:CBO0543 family protein [Peribacillus cavernae]|nr:CBO0543 family protein [Peribacillus cavernae]